MLPALALRPDLRVILPPRRRSAAAASSCSRFRWLQQSGPVPAPPHGPGPVSSSAAGCSARAAAGGSLQAPGGARRPGAGSAGPAGSAAAGAGGGPRRGSGWGPASPHGRRRRPLRAEPRCPPGVFSPVEWREKALPGTAPGGAQALAELSAHARPGGQRDPAGGAAAPLTPAHVAAKNRAGGWV